MNLFWGKSQRSRSRVIKKHCRRGSLHSCECWLLLWFSLFIYHLLVNTACVRLARCSHRVPYYSGPVFVIDPRTPAAQSVRSPTLSFSSSTSLASCPRVHRSRPRRNLDAIQRLIYSSSRVRRRTTYPWETRSYSASPAVLFSSRFFRLFHIGHAVGIRRRFATDTQSIVVGLSVCLYVCWSPS